MGIFGLVLSVFLAVFVAWITILTLHNNSQAKDLASSQATIADLTKREQDFNQYYTLQMTNVLTAVTHLAPNSIITIDHSASAGGIVTLEVRPDESVVITIPPGGPFPTMSPNFPDGITHYWGTWPFATVSVKETK